VTITAACDNKVSSVGEKEKGGLFNSTSIISTMLLLRMKIGNTVDSRLLRVDGKLTSQKIGNPG
jgi:hypothetical protein